MKRKFLYSESKLSEVTGLSRSVLKGCRIKGEYRHGKGKGGPVELSERAVQGVLERFGIQETNLDGATLGLGRDTKRALNQGDSASTSMSDAIAAGAGEACREILSRPAANDAPSAWMEALPELKLLHVSQIVPNKRILRARNGTGEIYQVIVPTSDQWAIGDPLRAKQSEKHKGYYELVGPSPRNRGDRYYRLTFV